MLSNMLKKSLILVMFAALPVAATVPDDILTSQSPLPAVNNYNEPLVVQGDGYSATITVGSLASKTPPSATNSATEFFNNDTNFISLIALMFIIIAIQGIMLFTINRNLKATRRMVRSISVSSAMNTVQNLKQRRQNLSAIDHSTPSLSESNTPIETPFFQKTPEQRTAQNLGAVVSGLCHKEPQHRLNCIRELGKIGRSMPEASSRITSILKAYVITLISEQSLKETTSKEVILALRILSGLNTENIVDFSGHNFSGIGLEGLTLQNMDFQNCLFNNVHFNNVQFMNCKFSGAMFTDASLKNIKLAGCDIAEQEMLHATDGLPVTPCNARTYRTDHNRDINTALDMNSQLGSFANDEQRRAQAIDAFKRTGFSISNSLDKSKLH